MTTRRDWEATHRDWDAKPYSDTINRKTKTGRACYSSVSVSETSTLPYIERIAEFDGDGKLVGRIRLVGFDSDGWRDAQFVYNVVLMLDRMKEWQRKIRLDGHDPFENGRD